MVGVFDGVGLFNGVGDGVIVTGRSTICVITTSRVTSTVEKTSTIWVDMTVSKMVTTSGEDDLHPTRNKVIINDPNARTQAQTRA